MCLCLEDEFEDLVTVQTAYKVTPALRQILEDPKPQEQELSDSLAEFVEWSSSPRYTFRAA